MEDFRILDPDPYNNATGSASLNSERLQLYKIFLTHRLTVTTFKAVIERAEEIAKIALL